MAFSMLWKKNCIMVQLKNTKSPPLCDFCPASKRSLILGIKNVHFQVGSSTCTEHGTKAGTDLTSSIKPEAFLSLKELPWRVEGHHPPFSLPGSPFCRRDSGGSPEVLMSAGILLSGKQRAEMLTVERLENNSVKKQFLCFLETEVISSAFTPSPSRATRAPHLCPEFKLGVSP